MKYSDESYNLRIELDTKDCDLSAAEIEKMERDLDHLADLVRDFPVSDLYLTIIHHPRSQDYHVKTSLVLTGRTLFTGDRDTLPHPAFERCVHKLVKKVQAYKQGLQNASERAKSIKGTHQEVVPDDTPDLQAINRAVQAGDYTAFRDATSVYEEPLRKRIGRWIQRYPEVEEQLDQKLTLNDIVEEVFLNAFENYERRPEEVRMGDWLESLIDPSLKLLVRHPDEEKDNINFARTLRETPRETE